jgi:thymidylate synthase
MIGHLTGLTPGTLVLSLADTHIYTNVIDAVKEQLSRPPRQWPQLEIVGQHRSIDDFAADSFRLTEYYPHPTLKMEMAV